MEAIEPPDPRESVLAKKTRESLVSRKDVDAENRQLASQCLFGFIRFVCCVGCFRLCYFDCFYQVTEDTAELVLGT